MTAPITRVEVDPFNWPDPQPIPDLLSPVMPFDPDLLPKSLRGWVTDIADRMQCPPDFPAVAAMIALSSVIGRKACIQPKRRDDWAVIPNLWGAVVGRPGVMKSPALTEAMKPIQRLQSEADRAYKAAMTEAAANSEVQQLIAAAVKNKAKALIKKGDDAAAKALLLKAGEVTEEPVLRRYVVTDSTVEALGETLRENPWGVLAYRDELSGLLRSLDKEGQEGARAFYLQAYDGNQSYTFDRIGRGRNLRIEAVCVSLLGGIQPGKLAAYVHDAVNGGAGDDGLLQRFSLLVWPDLSGDWQNVDRYPSSEARRQAREVFAALDAMQPGVDEDGEPCPRVYRFDDAAQNEFDSWRASLEHELRSGDLHPAVESHLSKYRKLVPALALVSALADGQEVVSEAALIRALAWATYLRPHAERAYGAGLRPQTEGAKALLRKVRSRAIDSPFTAREVYLKGWAHLSRTEAVKAAASVLCDLGHLIGEDIRHDSGGRPSIVYHINPKTLRGAA